MKMSLARTWYPSFSAKGLWHAIKSAFNQAGRQAWADMEETAGKRADSELRRHLSRLSNAELAKRGVSREDLLRHDGHLLS